MRNRACPCLEGNTLLYLQGPNVLYILLLAAGTIEIEYKRNRSPDPVWNAAATVFLKNNIMLIVSHKNKYQNEKIAKIDARR